MRIQLYGSGSATASAVAQITIPSAGTIRQIQYSCAIDAVTDNARVGLELSFVPASQINTNGAIDTIAAIRAQGNFATSGLAFGLINGVIPVSIGVRAGQIVYLNADTNGTITYYAGFILHL